MEFEIPEPGAWTRWLHANDATRAMIHKLPTPLTIDGNPFRPPNPTANPADKGNPQLNAQDIAADNYAALAAGYAVAGTSPPPAPLTLAVNLAAVSDVSSPPPRIDVGNQADTTLAIPNGYHVWSDSKKGPSWTASLMYTTADLGKGGIDDLHIDVAVGGGQPVRSAPSDAPGGQQGTATSVFGSVYRDQITGAAGPISQGNVPIALQIIDATGFEVNVEVYCVPLDETIEQWKNDTYGLIVAGYNAMLQAFNDELAGLTLHQTNIFDANSPSQNAETITPELKRQVIEMLIGAPFQGFNALTLDSSTNEPSTDLHEAAAIASEIQFVEQAFEWETLSYICYPYYWGARARWPDLAVIQGDDVNFADFLRAGSARVVLAARPGFEDQVNFFLQFGILWGGGPMPAAGDPDYLSIADEIKAMQQRPLDVTVVDAWQTRLPTTLIWLENPVDLPKNPNPSIIVYPKITAVIPDAGSAGALVTVVGQNFGAKQGNSTLQFNGTAAAVTSWSSICIVAAVPTGAASGDVAALVNGFESNHVAFTVG